jgi:ubiquinone/menaquinone biosynthesis C-methylase UbiE
MSQRRFASRALLRWTAWAWLLVFVFLVGIACGVPLPAGGQDAAATATKRQPAKVMGFEGAAWLEREGRAEEEKPEVVLAAMALRDGLTVAEIGAGTGFFSRRLARAVGSAGKVYAVDIQPGMLDLLKTYAAREGITNVIPVLGTETDPRLPAHGIDRILLVDVYHELQQPEPVLARIRDSLAPGGTVTLVEYRLEGDTASQIKIEHRMSVEQVLAEWHAAGFELLDQLETLPSQHLFIFSARRGARPR